MNDKEADALIARVRPLVEKWRDLMRLDNHTINIKWDRSYSSEGSMDAVTHMDRWKYLEFDIRFYLPSFAEYSDEEIEDLVVHELCHCLLAPMSRNMVPSDSDYQADIMELNTSQVAAALLKVYRSQQEKF